MTKTRVSVKPEDELKPGDFAIIEGFDSMGHSWDGRESSTVKVKEVSLTQFQFVLHSDPHTISKRNILTAWREVEPEPKVEVGTWQCSVSTGTWTSHCPQCRVLRSTGWSPDTRKGERRNGAIRRFNVGEYVTRWHRESVKVSSVSPDRSAVLGHFPASCGESGFDHIERRKGRDRRKS